MSKNNTFEINNGFLFDNIKTGNYYQITEQTVNKVVRAPYEQDSIGLIYVVLDSKSSHLESSTNSILDIIGTIGGSFELIHYVILTMFLSLRKNLYFHTMINRVNIYQSNQNKLDMSMHKNRNGRT